MGKKRKRKKQSIATDLKAIYQRGMQLYLEKNIVNEAVEWFKKAEEANCLFAPAAYYFGLLLNLEKEKGAKALNPFKRRQEKDMTWHTKN